ncbi:MAG: HPF/RaiA family ribosome-associated protein [Candidatus Promineifilaceae bacterium]|nr:HPF/RaiA family ribosome-associated protein [Candidatus Promineifilaceae bacterium]
MPDIDELDFTIEFYSDIDDKLFEARLMEMAEGRLRELAEGHSDLTSAAVTVRKQAAGQTPIYEATVVAYVRPEDQVGKEKDESPHNALKEALDAVERQVREKREKLRERWEQPQNDPVSQEMIELAAAREQEEEWAEENE